MKTILIACIALLAGACTDSAPPPEPVTVTGQATLTNANASISQGDAQTPAVPTQVAPNMVVPQPNPPCTSCPFTQSSPLVSPQ